MRKDALRVIMLVVLWAYVFSFGLGVDVSAEYDRILDPDVVKDNRDIKADDNYSKAVIRAVDEHLKDMVNRKYDEDVLSKYNPYSLRIVSQNASNSDTDVHVNHVRKQVLTYSEVLDLFKHENITNYDLSDEVNHITIDMVYRPVSSKTIIEVSDHLEKIDSEIHSVIKSRLNAEQVGLLTINWKWDGDYLYERYVDDYINTEFMSRSERNKYDTVLYDKYGYVNGYYLEKRYISDFDENKKYIKDADGVRILGVDREFILKDNFLLDSKGNMIQNVRDYNRHFLKYGVLDEDE